MKQILVLQLVVAGWCADGCLDQRVTHGIVLACSCTVCCFCVCVHRVVQVV